MTTNPVLSKTIDFGSLNSEDAYFLLESLQSLSLDEIISSLDYLSKGLKKTNASEFSGPISRIEEVQRKILVLLEKYQENEKELSDIQKKFLVHPSWDDVIDCVILTC